MGTLLLKLAGPLQAWGSDSRYSERRTRHEPTKSGIIGMLASALGRRREDEIEDLSCLKVGVRIDQGGVLVKDYQTSHTRKYDKKSSRWVPDDNYVTNRYYLADAVFVAGIEVPDERLDTYAHAFLEPVFPLYLGRRSCPPSCKVLLSAQEGSGLGEALSRAPWQATSRGLLRAHGGDRLVELEVLRDVLPTDGNRPDVYEDVRDLPVSFSQEFRQYAWRRVVHAKVNAPNPHCLDTDHDPFAALEEAR